MEFRIISLPPFRAASSGLVRDFGFSPESPLGRFNAYFSAITPSPRDSFMPRDFLCHAAEENAMIWLFALSEGMDDGGYEVVDCEGGWYLTYAYWDGDEASRGRLYGEVLEYIESSGIFETDIRPGHYAMGHIITPHEIIPVWGRAQMEAFIPIKRREV